MPSTFRKSMLSATTEIVIAAASLSLSCVALSFFAWWILAECRRSPEEKPDAETRAPTPEKDIETPTGSIRLEEQRQGLPVIRLFPLGTIVEAEDEATMEEVDLEQPERSSHGIWLVPKLMRV